MESRTENSNGTTVPKQSKSLDLKSLYKSQLSLKTSKKNIKRINSSIGDGDEKRNRKKAKREVSLSSLENGDGSSELKLGVSQRFNSSVSNKVSFGVCGDDFHIPKRKRSFMRKKKSEPGQALNLVEHPDCRSGYVHPVPNLGSDDDLGSGVESFKTKHKKEFDEFNKENRNSDSNSVQNFKENGDCASHSLVNIDGGDSSLTKSRSKNRKRKTSALDTTKVSKEVEPLVSSCKISDDLQEDEEENLEENAARMLSSRFDPSCTGFSTKGSNGLSFFQSSSQSIVNRDLKFQSGSESASADTDGRVLRPRKQYKSKGNSRKRRHFYEILLGDVDVYWVLNRRIKIFWPLDQRWYYGLVDDYDEGSKLYHIKYDDRDVEWVNLHTERFKLLLLRSEVPGNAKGERAFAKRRSSDQQKGSKSRKERQRTEHNTENDHHGGSSMDSEPIISWLARSSHRFISSFQGTKKQKTSVTLPSTTSSFLYDEPATTKGQLCKPSLKGVENNLFSDYGSQDKLSDDFRMKSSLQSATCNKDVKQPIVYFRRRIRKPALIPSHIHEEKHAIRSVSGSVSLDHMFGVENMKNSSDDMDEVEGPLCFTYKAGVSKVFWDMESLFRFGLNFPMCFMLNNHFESENLWLLYPLFLLQYGTVMTKWPRVCLEMLFVDNVLGLRFLLFEGCLNMAVAFVFFVLRVFHQPASRGKYVDLQFPCTSIGFKFSGLHVIKKPLVFEFYNFSGVNNSKWTDLDSKLKRHCLLSKKLHLSECTYDNIQALQNGSSGLSTTSVSGSSAVKVMHRGRPGINIMGISKVSTQADIHQYSDVGDRKLPPFTLSFAAAPTFFLSFHLKLLMEQSATHISFSDHTPEFDQEDPSLGTNGCTSTNGCSNRNSEIIPRKDIEILSNGAAGDGGSCNDSDHPFTFNYQIPSQEYQNIGPSSFGTSNSHRSERLDTTHLPEWQSHHMEQELGSLPLSSLIHQDKDDDCSHSFIGDLSIQIPVDQFEKPGGDGDGDLRDAEHSPDISWNGGVMPSSNLTALRSSWYRNPNSSSLLRFQSHVWSDGKADSLYNDFNSGPKKPRTQVSYSVPSAGYEFSSRQRNHHQKGLPHKRIRKASEKKSSDVRVPEKNFECLSCGANVLITLGDKGWRESGAHIVLELFDHNEWRLSVKLLGITRYSYKAHQFLQPGSTNRYTHAMMWKGGKDWILEFPDRSQWTLFKEMHEECYNRNIRAASVKNIPIPGVRLIEENDDNGCEATFVRSFMYFQQVETDVEMALDPSRVLYDMDSEDERWIANAQNSVKDNSDSSWISEEMFEKTLDMFEKVAYTKKRDQFTSNEIEELTVDVGPLSIVKIIYDHWQERRKKSGMALIRQFQPPLWERYQKQVREWEVAMTKNNTHSNACVDKVTTLEKPAMFAFCMKPRGLESVNKGLKHRSQKKISVSGHANSNLDQDGFRRRYNALPFGDEKFLYQGHYYDSFDESPLPLTSPRMFVPRDAGSLKYHPTSKGSGYRNHVPKFHQSRYDVPHNRHHLLAGPKRQGIEQLDTSVLEELRLRDAVAEARIKRHMAKLKRDRAKRLLYKADVAIHKSITALMIAEAMNASLDSLGEIKASEY
ncbi:uncharacterized protein LOC106765033 isoform X1 [Vigna radiata var. radiata]|uniref:Enhancer of polycomb-like protein n=1 Tax=Vigna radiata var. radiata TaxID=3916 RepID=A0A1S3UG43_VIGRR|nr:uncharacterized protein LOC106765033 isoform X1 [Vigna radiata var. radiata]